MHTFAAPRCYWPILTLTQYPTLIFQNIISSSLVHSLPMFQISLKFTRKFLSYRCHIEAVNRRSKLPATVICDSVEICQFHASESTSGL